MYKIFIFNCCDCNTRTAIRIPKNISIDSKLCIECFNKRDKIEFMINPLFFSIMSKNLLNNV